MSYVAAWWFEPSSPWYKSNILVYTCVFLNYKSIMAVAWIHVLKHMLGIATTVVENLRPRGQMWPSSLLHLGLETLPGRVTSTQVSLLARPDYILLKYFCLVGMGP